MRVGIVLLVSAAPAPILAAIGYAGPRTLAIAVAVGVGIAVIGINRVVTLPLRALSDAVDVWRVGGAFEVPDQHRLPTELRGLALSFKRSTRTLARREAELKVAVQRQELAMQEIHHRVKNNLQIVASLLNLQASRIRLPEARAEFQSARDRVRALATVHRHLYAHGELHTINMRTFLLELCGQLFQAMGETVNGRLSLDIVAPELEMSSDQAVPLSLIVTEAVTNAIKYAYPAGRTGTISVRLRREAEGVELEIKDDGIGIPAGRAETATGTRDGIGIQLINGFARQLGAKVAVEQGVGTRYLVQMKLRRERPDAPVLGR
jgi:two-component sensor histidine kinase